MDAEEPPDLTVIIYKTFTRQYFPIVVGNNGQIDEQLKKFSNSKHIFWEYKIKPKYEKDLFKLCENSFGKGEKIVRKRIKKLLENGGF